MLTPRFEIRKWTLTKDRTRFPNTYIGTHVSHDDEERAADPGGEDDPVGEERGGVGEEVHDGLGEGEDVCGVGPVQGHRARAPQYTRQHLWRNFLSDGWPASPVHGDLAVARGLSRRSKSAVRYRRR